ncbi:hypothetical protein EVAR_38328_1 [Eumeta japonica]|uniref:Uncharacterized protein n=1 Tax=Eumeta variegata TaxID=151549 RepID=A0A4C1X3E8_EUMVA|nr:hypothetical protein EVAR_38328_1 [Eumeta japonica]
MDVYWPDEAGDKILFSLPAASSHTEDNLSCCRWERRRHSCTGIALIIQRPSRSRFKLPLAPRKFRAESRPRRFLYARRFSVVSMAFSHGKNG